MFSNGLFHNLKLNGINHEYASPVNDPNVRSAGNNVNRLFVVQIIIVHDNQTSQCSFNGS